MSGIAAEAIVLYYSDADKLVLACLVFRILTKTLTN